MKAIDCYEFDSDDNGDSDGDDSGDGDDDGSGGDHADDAEV